MDWPNVSCLSSGFQAEQPLLPTGFTWCTSSMCAVHTGAAQYPSVLAKTRLLALLKTLLQLCTHFVRQLCTVHSNTSVVQRHVQWVLKAAGHPRLHLLMVLQQQEGVY